MNQLKYPLFFTRLAIFYFLLPWVLMRFTAADHAKNIAAKYYLVSDMSSMLNLLIGIGWMVLLVGFLCGVKKRITYGLVLLFHSLGTAFTAPYLIIGTESMKILFFAAIPVIGAMWLLYVLRDQDTFLTVGRFQ